MLGRKKIVVFVVRFSEVGRCVELEAFDLAQIATL